MTAEEPVNEDPILAFDEMEGQEAILVEEEVPVQKQASVKKKLTKALQGGERRKKPKKKRSLFKKSVDVESREEKDEVEQVSPKEVAKTVSKTRVVLLDPADDNETKKKQAAAHRVEYSRKLLEVALRPHDKATAGITEEEREKMTRAAFQQAAEARLLVEGEVDEDLATVISENASKGEAAATKAQYILSPKNATGASKAEGSIGKDKVVKQGEKEENQAPLPEDNEAWHNRYNPTDLFDEAETHANKARQHLEAILPVFECLPTDHESLPPQQMLPTQGIFTDAYEECTLSTLGFDNTFQETVISITSLNEILDAPLSPSESKVNAPGSALAEDTDGAKKGRLGLFKRLSQKASKNELKERSTAQDAPASTVPKATKSSNDEKSSAKVKEAKERPMERFIATVVQNDDENSVCSDISNSSELERIKALETRTDSKLKEAMENDETGSLCSWHGVPLFAQAPSPEPNKQTKDEGKTKEVEEVKPLLVRDHEQGRAHSFKELKPNFVTAPDFDPKVLTSRSWDDAVAEKEEAELKEKEEELAKAKKKKWGLIGWGRHNTDKQEDKEDIAAFKKQTKNGDSDEMQGDSDAIVSGDTPPGNVDDHLQMNEIEAPSIKANEEGGDRYALIGKRNDTAGESEKEQVQEGVDMMPDRPDPMDVRNASSLDAEQRADDSDDIKFADVEIGTEQVEKKILSRETVMQKIKAPRSSKVSAEVNNVERVRTLPSVEGMSDIEPSASMIKEIEKQNEIKKTDKKVDKQHSRFLKRVFGKNKRNKSIGKSGLEDSHPPAMCLVNTGSSSDSAQKAGMQTENEAVEASLL